MNLIRKENSILVSGLTDFNLDQIFDCGQAFRWERSDDGGYMGVVGSKVIAVRQTPQGVLFDNCTPVQFQSVMVPYFDLNRDYAALKKRIAKDDIMKQAVAFGSGIRILKQDIWEMILTFLLSQQSSIPRIKKMIAALCEAFGTEMVYRGRRFYSIPSVAVLAGKEKDDLACLRCGYRDKYLLDAAQKVAGGEVDLGELENLPYADAAAELKKIKGIGDKVAQCILLFGLHKFEVFPVDTWILKAMTNRYRLDVREIAPFAARYFGQEAGLAQQYLFFCEREGGFTEPAKVG